MNLSGQVILDSFRVIGLKDTDKEKLIAAYMKQVPESSFTAPVEVIDESTTLEAEVAPVEEPTIIVEPVQAEEAPTDPESVVVPEVTVEQAPVAEPSIFDQTVPSFEQNDVNGGVTREQVQETPITVEEVQGGRTEEVNNPTDLDTPFTFFEKAEQEQNGGTTPEVNNKEYMNDDPAIIMLDNLRKVVEDKNQMIDALRNQNELLKEQLRTSEEARKISEAQRAAAEATLQAARANEAALNNGPTLVYGQPQNYNQAA